MFECGWAIPQEDRIKVFGRLVRDAIRQYDPVAAEKLRPPFRDESGIAGTWMDRDERRVRKLLSVGISMPLNGH